MSLKVGGGKPELSGMVKSVVHLCLRARHSNNPWWPWHWARSLLSPEGPAREGTVNDWPELSSFSYIDKFPQSAWPPPPNFSALLILREGFGGPFNWLFLMTYNPTMQVCQDTCQDIEFRGLRLVISPITGTIAGCYGSFENCWSVCVRNGHKP